MKSKRSRRFRALFDALPGDIQRQANTAYQKFNLDPYHPSLHFKRVGHPEPLYSVRIGQHYRALGLRQSDDKIIWVWIGAHDEYDKKIG